ncbi:MAG: MFS transporter [Chitinophagaceae bacterium]
MISPTLSLNVSHKIHRIAVGSIFFLYGLAFASWASRIPSIQENLKLSDTMLGVVLFALPVGLMLSLPLSGWLTTKLGSRKVVIISAFLYSLTLVSLGLAREVYQLVGGLFVFGLAGNMLNISINTQAVGVEALYKRSIMASFHGLWSLAGFIGAAVGSFMIGHNIYPFQHFVFILVAAVGVILVSSRFILPEDINKNENQPIFAKPDKSLINLGILAFCSMICEGAMFDWSGVYFRKVVNAENAWMGVGYTAFMSTMAFGRFFADWLTVRVGLKRILQLSGTLTATGLLVAVLFPYLSTSIFGFLLVGLGVSSVIPLIYGAAGKSKTMTPGVAIAAVSTIGFLGFLLGPPVIGLVAGATSLRISFVIIAAMGLCISIVATRSTL